MVVTMDLQTVPAALKRLGIGKTYFYKLIAYGEIRVLKVGGVTYVTDGELDRVWKLRCANAEIRSRGAALVRYNKEKARA